MVTPAPAVSGWKVASAASSLPTTSRAKCARGTRWPSIGTSASSRCEYVLVLLAVVLAVVVLWCWWCCGGSGDGGVGSGGDGVGGVVGGVGGGGGGGGVDGGGDLWLCTS